ncbi:MAG: elongation factor [Chlamydiales bacterium]|jgi:elongation factor P|nr:elongation factor [Chlamydiales bacterium]
MSTSNQLTPGMVISVNDHLYRVESVVKSTAAKNEIQQIKTKLRCLEKDDILEKTFKPNQPVQQVSLEERHLEFLYLEGEDYLFLDIGSLENVKVPRHVIGQAGAFIKEGVGLQATFYGNVIFTVELPQFLELMVEDVEEDDSIGVPVSNALKIAILETGARLRVPPFIEPGDIVKIDTKAEEYVQRV